MVDLQYVFKQLKQERRRTQKELERLENAVAAFGKLLGRRAAKPRGKISAATRKKIVAAQRARWAKLKAR
jgi:hypothetical protein